jgi:hypothetical protein
MFEEYPSISKYLGGWLEQLAALKQDDEYAVLLDEYTGQDEWPSHRENLTMLDRHTEAVGKISDLDVMVREKKTLPPDLDQANQTVLDKLAEVRAVWGLTRLGFSNIRFTTWPDLGAQYHGQEVAIDVTRLSASGVEGHVGSRADVWDAQDEPEPGMKVGLMSSGGKWPDRLGEAVYREIEGKNRQLRKHRDSAIGVLWISLGRDYLTAGKYELPGVGLSQNMKRTDFAAVMEAVVVNDRPV